MSEDLDKFKEQLNQWTSSVPAGGRIGEQWNSNGASSDASGSRPRARLQGARAGATGLYPKGTLLCVDEEELVIYRRPVEGKALHMVYTLIADGEVKIEAIELEKHEVVRMGQMPAAEFRTLQERNRWTRQLIASGCEDPDDADRIPDPEGWVDDDPASSAPDTVVEMEPHRSISSQNGNEESLRRARESVRSSARSTPRVEPVRAAGGSGTVDGKIRRGQEITMNFGGKSWSAVYWGRDLNGSVVAHRTHGSWALMHLDLEQYKDSISIKSEPNPDLVEDISRTLSTMIDR